MQLIEIISIIFVISIGYFIFTSTILFWQNFSDQKKENLNFRYRFDLTEIREQDLKRELAEVKTLCQDLANEIFYLKLKLKNNKDE
jgi:hypothetical protein